MRPEDSTLGIFRSPDPGLCIPGHRILRSREPWPKSASRKEIVFKIKEIIEGDARFTVRDIA